MPERGRPSEYTSETAEQAYKLCLLGATDKEMADFFGVSETTINNWKQQHPDFLESITRGKTMADANVAEKLYQRALGYEHDDVHVSNYQGVVTLTPIRKYYPPDTPAGSLWRRNRQSAKWRDKQDHEHTGKDGAPLIPVINVTIDGGA
jgi:transposase-like protein